MRRPPSLDRPNTPEPPAERAGASATAKPRRGRKTADAAVPAAPSVPAPSVPAPSVPAAASGSDLNSATTEPITLPAPPGAASAALAPILALQRADEKPIVSNEKSKKPRSKAKRSGTKATSPDSPTVENAATGGTAAGDIARGDTPDDPDSLTPRSARKQLRAATKARKRYERGEVRRFTWRSRRRRRTWLVLGGALVALVAFVVVGAYSPLMALRTVEVVGTNRIPAEQVQAALSTQIGTPLPIVDVNQIKRELSTFTLIQSYSVESRPPNTLVVRIVEREPVGLLTTPAGFDLVDAAGVPLQSGAERVAGYPVIVAANGVGHPGFTAAAAVIRALPESIRSQLDSVTAATTDDVTLTLTGGARIVWGSAERSDYKAVVLASLMVTYPPGSVGEYDVTSPESAVLR